MPGILCEHCTAVCCRYIALPLDAPREAGDFDDIRWYLMHEGVSVFIEDDEWYISFVANCRHLQADHRCGVYETRPRICRSYSTANCDYHSGDYGWQEHFTCPEHLDEYRRRMSQQGRARKRKSGHGRKQHSRLRAHLRGRRSVTHDERYLHATTDIRGVPLPVLGAAQ